MHDFDPARGKDDGAAARPAGGSRAGKLALALGAVLITLLLVEIGFRVVTGVPVFKLVDWRLDQVQMSRLGEHGMRDDELGWSVRANFAGAKYGYNYNTIDLGFRRNFSETTVRAGHILAVGDSFTEGWEVDDAESWPAHLEKRTGIPVLNAGVSSYGTDQIILRAERFLPLVKPRILIVGFLEFDIVRTGFRWFGAPKPYFTIEKGELRYHPPAPFEPTTQGGTFSAVASALRRPLGYSKLADHLISRLAPNYWYGTDGVQFHRVSTNVVAVTCALLARLKKKTDASNVRTLLFMQYYAAVILENEQPTENARRVMDCARSVGIEVVDQFAPLRAIAKADPEAIWEYYLTKGEMFTHMTSFGNEHAAGLLAKAIGN